MGKQKDRDKVLGQAYTAATKRLREGHRDEFNKFYQEEAAARNVEWTPKLTDAQKAEQEFDRLLAEHPYLAERVPAPVEVAPSEAVNG